MSAKRQIQTVGELLAAANCTHSEAAALEGVSQPTISARKTWGVPSLFPLPEDTDQTIRVKNAIRWRLEGSGPITELGSDKQAKKRMVQDFLNRRLAESFVHNPGLRGGILLLAGKKLQLAIQPYLDMQLATGVISCETNPLVYKHQLSQYLSLHLPETVTLYNLDVLKAIDKLLSKDSSYWKGFDLDFDSSLDADKAKIVLKVLEQSQAESLWIRLAVTERPFGREETEQRVKTLVRCIQSIDKWDIEDLATGPVFRYCDTSPMAVAQVILSRR